MLFTLDGIVTDVRLAHPENAPTPILVTPGRIFTELSLAQLLNAHAPIYVTLDGIVTDVRLARLRNAPFQIVFTLGGIITSPFTPAIIILPSFEHSIPLTDENFWFSDETTKELNSPQPENAKFMSSPSLIKNAS